MTPEENAISLVDKYCELLKSDYPIDCSMKLCATRCAIICVEQIIDSGVNWTPFGSYFRKKTETLEYWKDVLDHLKK